MKKHIESFHEGLCYPCYQCDYKANMSHLKQYVKLVHEIYVTTKQPEKHIFSATIYTCYNVTIFKGGTLVNFPKIRKWQKNKKRGCPKFVENDEYWCSKHDFKSRFKKNVNKHHRAVHDKVKHPCSECDYETTQKSHLNEHIKSVHEGVKYPCSECEY